MLRLRATVGGGSGDRGRWGGEAPPSCLGSVSDSEGPRVAWVLPF